MLLSCIILPPSASSILLHRSCGGRVLELLSDLSISDGEGGSKEKTDNVELATFPGNTALRYAITGALHY